MPFHHAASSNPQTLWRTAPAVPAAPRPGSLCELSPPCPSQVCKDRRCQNASLFELEKCVSRCHGHGVSSAAPPGNPWAQGQPWEPNQGSPTGMGPVTPRISAFQTPPTPQLQVGLGWDLCSSLSKSEDCLWCKDHLQNLDQGLIGAGECLELRAGACSR